MTKKLLFCLITIVVISPKLFSQAGSVYVNRLWSVSTGNPVFNPILNPFGIKWSKTITCNSGEIVTVAHTTATAQGENILVTKFSASGTILFQKQHHTSSTNNEYGTDVVEDPTNGDIFVCGFTDNGGTSNYDGIVLKFDTYGNKTDSALFAHANGLNDVFTSIKLNASNQVVIGGSTENSVTGYDYLVVKYTNSLTSPTANEYDYSGLDDFGIGVEIKTGPNQINIIGASASTSVSCDYAVAIFNGISLSYVSDVRNNIPGTAIDQALSYCKDTSDNVYITGKAFDGTSFNIKTVKISSTYSISWTATLNPNNYDDAGTSVAVDGSGDVIVGGYIGNSGNVKNFICQKLNSSNGSQIWEYNQPSVNPSGDAYISKLVVNSSNNGIYYVAGEKGTSGNNEVLVGKIKSNGERNWMKSIASPTTNILPSDILTESADVYVISVIDPTASTYQTTKFSELELDTTTEYVSNKPYRLKNQLLVTFQPDAVVSAKVNDKEFVHGKVEDFINSTALASLVGDSHIDEIGGYKCYKVFPWMVMDDSMSVTRSGRPIIIYPHYTTFGILLPPTGPDSIPLKSISAAPNVVRNAQYNRYVFLNVGANDTEYNNGNSAALKTTSLISSANINIEPAWDITSGDNNIRVGVFDTGINFTHLDFGNGTFAGSKIAGGYDYQGNIALSNTTSNDIFGHGTAVADKIGALRNNNYAISGIAGGDGNGNTGVRIYDMKIFGIGNSCNFNRTVIALEGQVSSAIVQGATNNTVTSSGFAQNIQNHSWYGTPLYGAVLQAFITAYQNEVLMVVSSGNDAATYTAPCSGYKYPASYKDNIVMKVGANDNTGSRANFSECDHRLDFIAPGTNDLYSSLTRTGSATTDILIWPPNPACTFAIDGTSFAAPHSAGTAALMLSYSNNTFMPNGLFPEDVEQLMQLSAKDLSVSPNSPGYDSETGYGRIDAGQTLNNYHFPSYLVLHHTFTISASTAFTVGGIFENSCMAETKFGQQFGTYSKVKRYKITGTNTHTVPTGYTFVAGWERGAGSNLMEVLSSSGLTVTPPLCYTNGAMFEETRYIPDATNIIPTAPVSSVTASFEGYIYEIYDPSTNLPLGWYPFDKTGTAVFAYTTYWKSATLGLNENIFTENSIYMFPNPTMDKIYFKSQLKEIDRINVEIYSTLGQLVLSRKNLYLSDSNLLDVSTLSNGVYFVELTYGGKTIVNKIIVSK